MNIKEISDTLNAFADLAYAIGCFMDDELELFENTLFALHNIALKYPELEG